MSCLVGTICCVQDVVIGLQLINILFAFGTHTQGYVYFHDNVGSRHPAPHLNVKFAPDLRKATWNSGFAPGFIGFAPGFAPMFWSQNLKEAARNLRICPRPGLTFL